MARAHRRKSCRRRRRYQLAKKPTPAHFVRLKLPRVEITHGRQWYVVRTMANLDRRFEREARQLGAETYIPTLVEERVRRNRKIEVGVYPAAGYVFLGTQEPPGSVLAFGRCDGALEV